MKKRGDQFGWEEIKKYILGGYPMQNFGAGFSYYEEEEREFLKQGEYFAKIRDVQDNKRLDGVKDVFLQIKDHPFATPNIMTLFSRPIEGAPKANGGVITKENVVTWDKSMSRFFRAFGIQAGDFNFEHWKGHTAWITVKENKNDPRYSQIFVAFNQHKEQTAAAPSAPVAPQAVQNVANAVGGSVQQVNNGYTEDIPF